MTTLSRPVPEPRTDAPAGAPRRRVVLWVSLGVASLLAAFVAVLATSGPANQVTGGSPLLGRPAPPVNGPDGSGATVSLASYRGRWVLVNFAASWCTPCRQETPQMLTFAARHTGPTAPAVMTVEYQPSDLTSLRSFLASRHAAWPVVDDPTAFVSYGSGGLPESYLVDPAGTVVVKVTGGVVADKLDAVLASYPVAATPTGSSPAGGSAGG